MTFILDAVEKKMFLFTFLLRYNSKILVLFVSSPVNPNVTNTSLISFIPAVKPNPWFVFDPIDEIQDRCYAHGQTLLLVTQPHTHINILKTPSAHPHLCFSLGPWRQTAELGYSPPPCPPCPHKAAADNSEVYAAAGRVFGMYSGIGFLPSTSSMTENTVIIRSRRRRRMCQRVRKKEAESRGAAGEGVEAAAAPPFELRSSVMIVKCGE